MKGTVSMLRTETIFHPFVLTAPDGDFTVTIAHTVTHDPSQIKKVSNAYGDDYILYDVTDASVSLEWNRETYCGRGMENACQTEGALRDLERKLLAGIKIKSCLTCRHGNFCTFGSNDNEIFCVPDLEPKQKTDLDFIFLSEKPDEWLKRRRSLFHVCPEYKPDSAECWSYE